MMVLYLAAILWPSLQLDAAEFAVTEVARGIFVHQGRHEEMTVENDGDIANSGFIIGSDAVAVIDPGGSVRNGALLRAAIGERTELPVRYVVLTHFHPDHVAGIAAFGDSVEVVAHVNYPRAVAQRAEFYLDRFAEFFGPDTARTMTLPDILVSDSLQLDLGERVLVVDAHPTAHTDNDLSVADLATNTLFAGDLLFAQRTPSLDGSLSGWLDVLATLAARHYEFVIPGHGKPAAWTAVAGTLVSYLNALRDEVRQELRHGETLSQAIASGSRDKNKAGWQLFAQVHPTNISKAYTELEWE